MLCLFPRRIRGQFITVLCFAMGVPGIIKGGCSDPGLNHNSSPHGIVKTMESISRIGFCHGLTWQHALSFQSHLCSSSHTQGGSSTSSGVRTLRSHCSWPLANTQCRGPSLKCSTPLLLLHVSVEDGVTCVHTQGADRSKLRLDPLHDVGNLAHLTRLVHCDLVRERRTVEHGLDVECFRRDVFHFVPSLFLLVQVPERIVLHERQLLHDST
mmetsp:Transcript_46571/g.124502  ORF Transcript_46571/g.124502 Transcript_46571/m.124502 type:complete len:212 (-) Transcript_46571:223-858(-)